MQVLLSYFCNASMKHQKILLGFLLCFGLPAYSMAQAPADSTKRQTSLVIKVIKGGPCGDADPALVESPAEHSHSIALDMACSCLQKHLFRKEEQL